MLKMLAVLILIASALAAQDTIGPLVEKLASEEFEIRVEATNQLGEYPVEYIKIFFMMADGAKDPEVQWRLKAAAKLIFKQKIGCKDTQWLKMHGSFGIQGEAIQEKIERHYLEPERGEGPPSQRTYHDYSSVGFMVNWIKEKSAAGNLFKQFDVIEQVKEVKPDGQATSYTDTVIEAEAEYDLIVRRYKDVEKIMDGGYLVGENKDYETKSIRIKAGWKESEELDPQAEKELMDKLWENYLLNHP